MQPPPARPAEERGLYADVEEIGKPARDDAPASPMGLHIERTLELSTSSDSVSPRPPLHRSPQRNMLKSSYRDVNLAKPLDEDGGYAMPTAEDGVSSDDEAPKPAPGHLPVNRSQRVWYQELQYALARDDQEKHRLLYALARDFVHASELYGKVIISEAFLPLAEKTIKPWESCPGVAGGTKYLYKDIFFKFATDLLLKDTDIWMYGGSARSDHYAMKAARHELKALKAVYNANVPGINLPLVCLITYRGFSLICISRLPINTASIIYGSDDATRVRSATEFINTAPNNIGNFIAIPRHQTMHNADEQFSALMDRLGERLKLAAHQVRGKRIVGPADIEGHKGPDNRYYLVDLARLYPLGRWVFYHLLRPELVKSLPNALSSDVFLGWVRGDPDAKKFEEDVKAATRYLHNQVIPSFAKGLEERAEEFLQLGPAKSVQFLHATGINCRHIGEVRSHTQHAGMRKLLATEMVSRVVKNDIALRLRSKMAELGLAFEAPYQHEVHAYLSVVFSRFPHGPDELSVAASRGSAHVLDGGVVEIGKAGSGGFGYMPANRSLSDALSYFYMEIEVIEDGQGLVILGLMHARWVLPADRCPGWDNNYGYHGDSGEKFHKNLSNSYGPPIHSGDIIGMFWSSRDGTLIFTHNGQSLGVAWHGIMGEWMPVVYGWGETGRVAFRVNFGATPFRVHPSTLHPAAAASDAADKFWKMDIKARVEELFPGALTKEEQKPEYSLLRCIDDSMLVDRVSELASVKLSKRVEREIGDVQGFQLLPSDIYALRACVDQSRFRLPLAKVSEAAVLVHEVASGEAISPQYALRLLRMAQDLLDASEVRTHEALYLSGCIYLEQAFRATPIEEHNLARTASQRLREAVQAGEIELGKPYGKALMVLGDCMCLLGRRLLSNLEMKGAEEAFEEAEECYHRSLSGPKHEVVLEGLKKSIRRDVRLLEGQPSKEKADGLIKTALARAIPVMGQTALDPDTALTLFNGVVAFLVSTGARLNAMHYYEQAAPLLIIVTESAAERFRSYVKEVVAVQGSQSKLVILAHVVSILGDSVARNIVLTELAASTHLDFFNCGSLFTNESLGILCNQCRNVESLCVSEFKNHLADIIVARFAEHGTIKSLLARRCNLTDAGLQSLVDYCAGLTSLDLSESHLITQDGLLLLEPIAPRLRKLRILGLPATDTFCELVLAHATSLSELCMSHCGYVTDDGWAKLALCTELELFQCYYASLTGVRLLALVSHWPRLVRVLDVRGIRFASRDELATLRRVVPATCKITFLLGSSDGSTTDDEEEEGVKAPEPGNNQT